jgi:hypothetical protein
VSRTATIPASSLPHYLDTLRDPAKVADLEASNASDVVLGRRIRDIDDSALQRLRGLSSLSETARQKLEREAKRREASPSDAWLNAETGRSARVREDVATEVDAKAHEAATSPLSDKPQPTPAQIEAGTYRKGHVDLHGLDISIENPAGSVRSGVDSGGKAWQVEMRHHYGYIKGSVAKDGDHVDVFIGEHPASTRAFIIDQVDPLTGKYDEPKVILGALNAADAQRIYRANYEPGWKGMGAVTEMPVDQFKTWVKSADAKKPVALPKIAGKHVTELDDAALQRIAEGKAYGEPAKVKARAEIDRRATSAEFSAAVRDQLGEPPYLAL